MTTTSSSTTVTLPSLLIVDHGALVGLPSRLRDAGLSLERTLVLAGHRVSRIIARRFATDLRRADCEARIVDRLGGLTDEAWQVARLASDTEQDVIVALGGGRIIDVAKLAGRLADVDVISVPTSLGNDGVSSPVASLRDADGVRRSHAARMPQAVVVDIDCVASAPAQTLAAGCGDLLSNLTAVLDWRHAAAEQNEPFDEFSATLAEQAALPLLSASRLDSADTIRRLASGLVVGGLAMAIAGSSRPCSGAEHLISHALDEVLGPAAPLHGLQVGFASLLVARLHGQHEAALRTAMHRLGLPTTCEDLGVDPHDLVQAIRRAPQMRPGRTTVLDRLELGDLDGVRAMVEQVYRTGPLAGVPR